MYINDWNELSEILKKMLYGVEEGKREEFISELYKKTDSEIGIYQILSEEIDSLLSRDKFNRFAADGSVFEKPISAKAKLISLYFDYKMLQTELSSDGVEICSDTVSEECNIPKDELFNIVIKELVPIYGTSVMAFIDCPVCGGVIDEDGIICEDCGFKIEEEGKSE